MNEGLKFGLRNKQQPDYFPDTILSDIHSTLRPNYGQPDVRDTSNVWRHHLRQLHAAEYRR